VSVVHSGQQTSTEAEAVTAVEDFLANIGAGRLEAAASSLAPGVSMVFPGGRRYSSLNELADASRLRYRSVDKVREQYDVTTGADGEIVVISTGTLFGENLHGVRYANVRYVDRFVLRDGLILLQQVWNDLAQSGVLDARTESDVAQQWRASGPGTSETGEPASTLPAAHVRRSATASWTGQLRRGVGRVALGSGASGSLDFSLESRKADATPATSPEELLAAAHASCFAMALRGALDRDAATAGTESGVGVVTVDATCMLRIDEAGWRIHAISLRVSVPGAVPEALRSAVATAEQKCAISLLVQGNAEVSVTIADTRP
jgi:OsmC subfamily peroxiredoxin